MTEDEARAGDPPPPVEDPLEVFHQFLVERDLRLTPERQRTLLEVVATPDHFGPEELVGRLRRGRPRVSRATVFRTLDLLLEAGLVRRLELGRLGVVYESDFGRAHHDHLACLGCGALFEFVSEEIERLQEEVCATHDFAPVRHLHRIMGLCRGCRDAGRTEARRVRQRARPGAGS